jgi:hypothetical protein
MMSSISLFLAVLLAGAVAAFVLNPILGHPRASRGMTRPNQVLETLENEKRRVLRAIRDLDFDYDLGKLPDAAYQSQRIDLVRLGAAILRRMDEVKAEIAEQESCIEKAVATLRRNY